ncbi:MAG: class I SAM-dependent methyltransferase [Alphaproteobacteria bacterium]|nr:class I SAM-dependent methyltransferase [Alphaproteobacteria bacterium]
MNTVRQQDKRPQDPETLNEKGSLAYKKGDMKRALDCFGQLVETGRHSPDHAIRLAHIMKNVTFGSFNPRWKKTILRCLQTQGVNYQDLAKSWFSVFQNDPVFKPLHHLAQDQNPNRTALKKALKDPFLLEGLSKLTVYDMGFENMLIALSRKTEFTGNPDFQKSFRAYCARTESIFMEKECPAVPPKEAKHIPSLGLSDNAVTGEVREHYEEHPYPRWTFIHRQTPSREQQTDRHKRLIAGCGTGFGACNAALRYPNAQITAFDISSASLSYASGKAEELELGNLNFMQADILNLNGLEEDFDIIECTGVLHHMEAPQKGLNALCASLKPGGKILLGLYSEKGRQDIAKARELIAENRLEPDHAGIRKARELIFALPENHPAKKVANRHDFYFLSNCRDLLFHRHEKTFTVDGLEKLIANAGLELIGFEHPEKRIKTFQDAQKAEEQDPDTFRGMYIFWCEKERK